MTDRVIIVGLLIAILLTDRVIIAGLLTCRVIIVGQVTVRVMTLHDPVFTINSDFPHNNICHYPHILFRRQCSFNFTFFNSISEI